jgi:UDP:flavonoid glycosyltransferase YjiC (YdhE family)
MQFVGPVLPQPHSHFQIPDWWSELDDTKPLVFVTQGTIANYDFDQLLNPALAALANEDLTVICTAGGGDVSLIKKQNNARDPSLTP